MGDYLSIIIPAYNEEDNIEPVVCESIEALAKLTDKFEVVVVDDHSTDSMPDVLIRLKEKFPQLVVLRNEHNIGCHPSSLVGFREARGDFRFFIPADRQIPASEISKFISKAKAGCDVVYSWRIKRKDRLHRRLISKLYNLILRVSFGINVHDADSSSLLTKRAVEEILPKIRSDSAFISVEILLEASRRQLGIGEVIIEHRPRVAGVARGINLKDLFNVPRNFFSMLCFVWKQKQTVEDSRASKA